jgi:hypothetical protein
MGANFDDGIDEDSFREAIADGILENMADELQQVVQEGDIECDCGSTAFDIETWKNRQDDIKAAGVCRQCNERMVIEVDTSDIGELRR